MIHRIVLITLWAAITLGALSWGAAGLRAQTAEPVTEQERVIMENYRLKAERVMEKRQARITHDQRQAVAERAHLVRPKPAPKAKIEKGGSGK